MSLAADQTAAQGLEFNIYNPDASRAKKTKGPVACAECRVAHPPLIYWV